jgi:hypothetical protein
MSATNPTTELAPAVQPTMFTEQQVADALNHAADDILDAVDAGDEGLRDGPEPARQRRRRVPNRPGAEPARRRPARLRRRLPDRPRLDRGGAVNSWRDAHDDQRRAAIAAVPDSPRGQHCRDRSTAS